MAELLLISLPTARLLAMLSNAVSATEAATAASVTDAVIVLIAHLAFATLSRRENAIVVTDADSAMT